MIFRDVPNLGSEPFTLENGNSSKMDIFFFVETRFPLAIGPCKSTIYTFLSLDCVVLTALNMLDLPLFMVRVANLAATSPPSTV